MKGPSCRDCTYFYQHYIIDTNRATPVNCGHCRYPRLKHRKADTPACGYFVRREGDDLPDRAEVIQFLTTDVLRQLLELSLPLETEKGQGVP